MEATLPTPDTDAPRRPAAAKPRAHTGKLAFLYLVPPILMALPLGMYRAGLGLPIPLSLLLWASVCLISWWLSEAFSHVASRVLRPWHPPVWLILTLGYLLNLWISSLYNVPIVAALISFGEVPPTPDLVAYFELERSLVDPHYLLMLLRAGAAGLVFWLTVNLLFQHLTGIERFGTAIAWRDSAPPLAAPGAAQANADAQQPVFAKPVTISRDLASPRFFDRLEKLRGLQPAELLAVEAEDHYVRVHSIRGKELIYYRFRDALDDLHSWDGLQTHRSVWVRRTSITRIEESGRSTWIVLDSGDKLPVSFANRALVRAAAVGT
jgi:hypothetical protein